MTPFIDGLTTVLKLTGKNPVLFEVINNKLYIASYTDAHNVVFTCSTTLDDFRAVLSSEVARQLPKVVKNSLELELNDYLLVSSDGVLLKLAIMNPLSISRTQLLLKYAKDIDWIVESDLLKTAFKTVRHSALSKEIGDIVMRGYHLTRKDNQLELMASNGAVLSLASIPLLQESTDRDGLLLLNQDFGAIISLLYDRDIRIGFTEDTISLYSTNGENELFIVSSLTNGTAINYKKVIDRVKDNPIHYRFYAADFLSAIDKNEFFTNKEVWNRVFLELDSKKITINSHNTYGYATTTVPLLEGPENSDIKLAINGIHLLKYFSSVIEKEVTLSVKDQQSPVMFTDNYETEIMLPLTMY